jgi:transposase
MGKKKMYDVNLSVDEQNHLENLISSGVERSRKLTRARILLKANEKWLDKDISTAVEVGQATVERIRKKYVEEGLEAALNRKPSSRQYERKLDGTAEAHLIALVCGKAPAGRMGWTLRLFADRLVQLEEVEVVSVSHETIRRVLKKTPSSPGKTSNG